LWRRWTRRRGHLAAAERGGPVEPGGREGDHSRCAPTRGHRRRTFWCTLAMRSFWSGIASISSIWRSGGRSIRGWRRWTCGMSGRWCWRCSRAPAVPGVVRPAAACTAGGQCQAAGPKKGSPAAPATPAKCSPVKRSRQPADLTRRAQRSGRTPVPSSRRASSRSRLAGGAAMNPRQENLITVLDAGSSKSCVLVAELQDGVLRYRGHGIEPSRGMRKGLIAELGPAAEAINRAALTAERWRARAIETAVVGIGGTHVRGGEQPRRNLDGQPDARDHARGGAGGGRPRALGGAAAGPRGAAPAAAGVHPGRPGGDSRPDRHGGATSWR
jgi:hypothetical protein